MSRGDKAVEEQINDLFKVWKTPSGEDLKKKQKEKNTHTLKDIATSESIVPSRKEAKTSLAENEKIHTIEDIQTTLAEKSPEEKMLLLKELLKQAEEEGNIRKLFEAFVQQDPKDFLIRLAGVERFEMAKFGVLGRAEKHFQHCK